MQLAEKLGINHLASLKFLNQVEFLLKCSPLVHRNLVDAMIMADEPEYSERDKYVERGEEYRDAPKNLKKIFVPLHNGFFYLTNII